MAGEEITVASTTDTQEVVNQVAGVEEELKVEKPGEEKPGEQQSPQHQRPSKFEKKINKLTARAKTAEEERDALKARIAELEKKPEEKPSASSEKRDEAKAKPDPKDFSTYEEYVEALSEYKAEQIVERTLAKREQTAENQSKQETLQAKFDAYNAGVEQAREKYDDFDDVVGQSTPIPQSAQVAIIGLENGPEIAYYLGQNPEVCERLVELVDDPVAVAVEVGRIAAGLAGGKPPAKAVAASAAPAKPAAAARPKTQAPEPVKPMGGGTTQSTIPLDELPYSEYRRRRMAERRV